MFFCFFIIPGEKLDDKQDKENYANEILFLFKNQFFEIKHFSDNSIYSSQKNFEYCIIGSKKEEENHTLKELTKIIQNQNEENEELRIKLTNQNQLNEEIKTKLTNQNQLNEEIKTKLTNQNQLNEKIKTKLADPFQLNEEEIKELKTELANQNQLNEEIKELKTELANQNQLNEEIKTKLTNQNQLNEEIKELKTELANQNQLNEEIKELKTKLTKQNNQIQELENKTEKQELFIKSTPELSRTSLGRSTSNGKITYRNWWVGHKSEFEGVLDEYWFSQFVNTKFPNDDFKLNFFSVWNNHCTISDKMEGKKIFYTAECMKRHQDITEKYGEYALNYVDLGLGFEYLDNPKYLRFPYWITRNVYPHMTDEYIETLFENWNTLDMPKTKNVSAINSHDKWKTRTLIANDVNKYTEIEYAGLWNKNTNDLVDKFNNNKIEYLKQFKFNICGENLIDDGYVTEKIFDAIKANCIPLYIGGGKQIEPKVLNEKAILRWYEHEDNSDTVELFKNLLTDEKSYKEFKDQRIFLDSAPKYVINKLNELEKKIGELIYS